MVVFDMLLRPPLVIFCTVMLLGAIRCNNQTDAQNLQTSSEAPSGEELLQKMPEQLKNNCYICHNPTAPSHDAIIAPPLAAVKMRYNRQYQTKAEFVENMTAFLLNPTKEKALMYGAVDRFGIMARSVLDEKTIREIAVYIYENKLEEPPWLKEEMGRRGMQ